MTEHSTLAGGCACGALRYTCGLPVLPPTFCHCTSCRRNIGATGVAWFTIARDSLHWSRTAPAIYASSPQVQRGFCPDCGCSLSYWHESYGRGKIDLTIATLDDPARIVPVDHIWMSDALEWEQPGDGRPQHSRFRTPE
ncbi:MAG: GFA family protein [Steroidobacteraceae bacterium]